MLLDDVGLNPAEQRFFDSGGTDTAGVLAEAGRSPAPEPDGAPSLSDAERRYFETGGDVTHDLLREHGHASEPPPLPPLRPELQAMLDRAVAAHQGERVEHARTSERLSILQESLAPPPAPAPAPIPPPDPEQDIFAAFHELRGRVDGYAQQIATGQREMAEEGAYRASLDAAVRQDPAVYEAYQHLLRSRAAELMASRYPHATPDQLMRAPVPQDINQILQQEERHLYKTSFAANRDPVADIVRLATMRGYVSPAQREAATKAAAEAQRRQHEAEAARKAEAEDIAWTERARFAQRRQYWDSDTELKYLTSARSNAHKRWLYDHEPGPPPPLPRDFR